MSPEQAQDASLGPASDRYSLGVIAYEAIFGHLPFSANSVPAVMLKHITEPVPIPAGTNPILASILRRALAKDPDQRWRSATDLISSLSEALIDALQSKVGAAEITRVVPTPLHKPRVLLVDDNAEQRSLIETRIKYAGLLAVVARTGPEGLSKLQSGSYDVVIVHTDLEWVTGLDIARRIRDIEQKYGSRAMIVASSARLDDAAKREAMANGIDQLIPRPVDQVFLDTLFKTYRPIRF
jgi:CheY-like chemotaxis protein